MQPLETERQVMWARYRASWRSISEENRKKALGLAFILAVALIWVS
jgi:hypothetical protein